MNSPRKKNILWLDDDLRPLSEGVTEERHRLQPWLKHLRRPEIKERINVIECQDLPTFRSELSARQHARPDDADFIDLLLIDLFWRPKSRAALSGFAVLGEAFTSETLLTLDAGAQLLSFLVNDRWKRHRPDWLATYADRPICVLTTLDDNSRTMEQWVEPAPLSRIKVILKDDERQEYEVIPGRDFRNWIATIAESN